MKIAFVSTEKLPVPAVLGGAVQIYISGVLPYLSKHHDITVFSGASPDLARAETRDGVRYVRITAKPGRYIEAVKSHLDGSFDLVHIFNRPLWLLSLCGTHPGLKYSLSLHNDMFHPDRMTVQEVYECVQKASFITAVSKYTADMAIRACPAANGKIHVVYSGVDAGMYRLSARETGLLDERNRLKGDIGLKDRKLVMFAGRLCPEKGVHVLIRAMRRIMDGREDAALVIAGSRAFGSSRDDKYVRSVKTLAKELKGPVIFTGFLTPDKLAEYYCMADIFVCPSQWQEPLARVLYEAMAAGLPVVVTDRGGNCEVVSDMANGVVVKEYGSSESLAQAISVLLDAPGDAEGMGMAGQAAVLRSFSWERVAGDIDRLINSALSA